MFENITPDQLKEIAKERVRADEIKFDSWWNKLSEERRTEYGKLRIFSSDGGDELKYHQRRCRYLLEVISGLKNEEGKMVRPVGLAIHGSYPVVLIQAEGHETPKGESLNVITYTERKGDITIYSDVNTFEYGIPTREAGVWKYKLDPEEVKNRLTEMI